MNWFKTDDVRIQDIEPLISPAILIKDYPATTEIAKMVATTRKNEMCIRDSDVGDVRGMPLRELLF